MAQAREGQQGDASEELMHAIDREASRFTWIPPLRAALYGEGLVPRAQEYRAVRA